MAECSALPDSLNPSLFVTDNTFAHKMREKVGFKVVFRQVNFKSRLEENITDIRCCVQSPHCRLQGGTDAQFTLIFIPGLQRQAHWKDEVCKPGGFVHEITKADYKDGTALKGILKPAFGWKGKDRIGIVDQQKVYGIFFKCLEKIECLGPTCRGLHSVTVHRVQKR